MATKWLWKIVEGSELTPLSTANDKIKKAYKHQCKKAFAIIAASLVTKSWYTSKNVNDRAKYKNFIQHPQAKNMLNILFMRCFFTIKMDNKHDMPDHINKA